jgi:hypothetical protein
MILALGHSRIERQSGAAFETFAILAVAVGGDSEAGGEPLSGAELGQVQLPKRLAQAIRNPYRRRLVGAGDEDGEPVVANGRITQGDAVLTAKSHAHNRRDMRAHRLGIIEGPSFLTPAQLIDPPMQDSMGGVPPLVAVHCEIDRTSQIVVLQQVTQGIALRT